MDAWVSRPFVSLHVASPSNPSYAIWRYTSFSCRKRFHHKKAVLCGWYKIFQIVRSFNIANCWWCLKLRTKRNEIPSRSSIHNEECKRSHGCITSKTDLNHSIHKILHQIEERNRLCVWYTSKTSWSCLSSLFWRWVKKTIISLLVFSLHINKNDSIVFTI